MPVNLNKRTISIIGCGWFGLPMAKMLISKNWAVKGSTTTAFKISVLREAGIDAFALNVDEPQSTFPAGLFASETILINIPPSRKKGQAGYLQKMESLFSFIEKEAVKRAIFISSTSVYGDVCRQVTELDEPDNRAELLQAEELFLSAKNVQTCIVRFGGLFGPDRNPGRFFKDKSSVPNGLAPVNLIHLSDCIGLVCKLLDQSEFLSGVYNAVAPTHPSRKDFYTKAIEKSGSKAPIFTEEKADWKIVDSIKSAPVLNYQFQYPDLLACLDHENAFN